MAANGRFYVRFIAPVTAESIGSLLQLVDRKIRQGALEMGLLLASPGGDVAHGLIAYNYLTGCPLSITTHSIGAVDSVGIVLFCAGQERLSVRFTRFVMHGAAIRIAGGTPFSEAELGEKLSAMRADMTNVSRVVAAATGRSEETVYADMENRTVLSPEEAIDYGLVHTIRSELFPAGAEIHAIEMGRPPLDRQPAGRPGSPPFPPARPPDLPRLA